MPSGAGPGCLAPWGRARAGGSLYAGTSAVLQPRHKSQALRASVMQQLTVLLPAGAPHAKGLLAFGAFPPN